jgi:putative chitinase
VPANLVHWTLPMNADQLRKVAPRALPFLPQINAAMAKFGIVSKASQAAFVAQMLHESANFTAMEENLNYSPDGLLANWPSRFTPALAAQYGRTAAHPANQTMIANIAYGGRMGNGPASTNDGYKWRGRGPGQLTGHDNYQHCGAALGIDLIGHPELVASVDVGCLAFAWFWAKGNPTGKSLNLLADAGQINAVSVAVNGGKKGLLERARLTRELLAAA